MVSRYGGRLTADVVALGALAQTRGTGLREQEKGPDSAGSVRRLLHVAGLETVEHELDLLLVVGRPGVQSVEG